MGAAVGRALAAGGARVVATVAGRSARTRRLAHGLELVPSLDDVVREAELVLSIVPPAEAARVGDDIAAAAERVGSRPLVADLNAVSPATVREIAETLGRTGLALVDGSISGSPPGDGSAPTRVYLSGPRADEVAALAAPGLDLRVVGAEVGTASAVKMSTASVYKGRVGLLWQALLAAERNGVLEHVLDDLHDAFPEIRARGGTTLARSAAKSGRFVAEMREIAATQEAAGLTPALFEAMADVYAALAATALAEGGPEEVDAEISLDEALRLVTDRY
jgi:3-hydroxyisobutyrate dehydrogenase-like beta-hydroxyacid dehydrogenase